MFSLPHMSDHYPVPSNRDSRQLKLPGIDYAPEKVRAHGLAETHTWPLVSKGKRGGDHSGSLRVHASGAWRFPEIELRAGNSWPSIVLDVDGANALYRIVDAVEHGEVLTPNWTVTRKTGGGTHAVWNLGLPVLRGDTARPGPLASLRHHPGSNLWMRKRGTSRQFKLSHSSRTDRASHTSFSRLQLSFFPKPGPAHPFRRAHSVRTTLLDRFFLNPISLRMLW